MSEMNSIAPQLAAWANLLAQQAWIIRAAADEEPGRPQTSLMLSGPSGIGKTWFITHAFARLRKMMRDEYGIDIPMGMVKGSDRVIPTTRWLAEASSPDRLDVLPGVLASRMNNFAHMFVDEALASGDRRVLSPIIDMLPTFVDGEATRFWVIALATNPPSDKYGTNSMMVQGINRTMLVHYPKLDQSAARLIYNMMTRGENLPQPSIKHLVDMMDMRQNIADMIWSLAEVNGIPMDADDPELSSFDNFPTIRTLNAMAAVIIVVNELGLDSDTEQIVVQHVARGYFGREYGNVIATALATASDTRTIKEILENPERFPVDKRLLHASIAFGIGQYLLKNYRTTESAERIAPKFATLFDWLADRVPVAAGILSWHYTKWIAVAKAPNAAMPKRLKDFWRIPVSRVAK